MVMPTLALESILYQTTIMRPTASVRSVPSWTNVPSVMQSSLMTIFVGNLTYYLINRCRDDFLDFFRMLHGDDS